MPLLAALIGSIASGLVAVFSRFMAFDLALKLAAYSAWLLVLSAFVVSVRICVSGLIAGLIGMFSAGSSIGGGIVSAFGMGLGVFIPANAGTVIACLASVWIACQIYKVSKQGMHNYSH